MPLPSFEEWLNENPQYQYAVDLVATKHGGILPEAAKEFLVQNSYRTYQQTMSLDRWLMLTFEISSKIAIGEPCESDFALFWIQLYGVVFDLFEKEDRTRQVTAQIDWRKPFVEALDLLYAELSQKERDFILYMRHNMVHPFVDSPWKRVRVQEGMIVELKPARYPEVLEVAEQMIKAYDGNQKAIAHNFATRLLPFLVELVSEFKKAAEI